MIIAAYAGTGKTNLATQLPGEFVEVMSMPYARILPVAEDGMIQEGEYEKAAPYHINNPLYPYNIVAAILQAERESKYVIIPPVTSVIDILQEQYGRVVILCYPEDTLEEEYRQRFLRRGNSERFIRIFADGLKNWVEILKSRKDVYHIVLKSGEYLADYFYKFDIIQYL